MKEMSVENIVQEVVLNLSSVYMNKLKEKGGKFLTPDEAIELYVEALNDCAKCYTNEINNHSGLH